MDISGILHWFLAATNKFFFINRKVGPVSLGSILSYNATFHAELSYLS